MMRDSLRRLCAFGVTLLASSVVGAVLAAPVHATPAFNRWRAVDYADLHACNSGACENADYRLMDADCTNFVSQSIFAGGMPVDPNGWWYSHTIWPGNWGETWSNSWSLVDGFTGYWGSNRHSYVVYSVASMASVYTAASPADLYLYDWGGRDQNGQPQGFSHLSISAGYGAFATVWVVDSAGQWLSTSTVTGGSGDFIDQHTENRRHTPWNLGFWKEKDLTTRGLMRTVILHWV